MNDSTLHILLFLRFLLVWERTMISSVRHALISYVYERNIKKSYGRKEVRMFIFMDVVLYWSVLWTVNGECCSWSRCKGNLQSCKVKVTCTCGCVAYSHEWVRDAWCYCIVQQLLVSWCRLMLLHSQVLILSLVVKIPEKWSVNIPCTCLHASKVFDSTV